MGSLVDIFSAWGDLSIARCGSPCPTAPKLARTIPRPVPIWRAASRLLQAVDFLFTRPVLTVRQIGDALGVNFSSIQRYINQLIQSGILHEITGQARNRVYVAGEILKVFDEPINLKHEGQ